MTNRAMSDSNVKWIGDIPNNWSVEPIGKLFTERNTKVSDLDFPPLSVTKKGIVPQLENAAKSKNHNDRKQVNSGDFVINSRSDRKMSSGLSSLDGSVSLINIVLTSKSVFPGYTKYLLKNYGFAEEFYRWGTGIVADLWSTRYERMKRILVPYPSYEEQQKIATFLDEKVSHIDTIIEDTKKSIENLKAYKQSLITETVTKGLDPNVEMKDSGIDWIGEIPAHWNIMKLSYLSRKIGDGIHSTPNYDDSGNYYFINGNNFYNKSIIYRKNTQRVNDSEFDKFKIDFDRNTIFISLNGTIGNLAYYNEEKIILGKSAGYIKIKKDIDRGFIYYYLLSAASKTAFDLSFAGTTINNLSLYTLRNLKVTIPSKEEQVEVSMFLDKKTQHIDLLINQKEKIINELESYKKSLIYEYVTGKKEVK